jgi:antirestriction protein ArdC
MKSRKDIEQEITDLVIKQLQDGKVPWKKPWSAKGFMPTSMTTGKTYSGINLLLLSILGADHSSPYWITYREAQKRGGFIRQGEKGVPIIKWSKYTRKDANGQDVDAFFMKQFTVFNIDQTANVKVPVMPQVDFSSIDEGVQSIIDSYATRPEIYHSIQDRAYYSPLTDAIHLPKKEMFTSAEEYALTLTHELIHSTGHESRLNRFNTDESIPTFGSAVYAKEELVADIGATMMLAQVGVQVELDNTASYLAGWLQALQNDSSLIVQASAKAQKAVDYILGAKQPIVDVNEEEAGLDSPIEA